MTVPAAPQVISGDDSTSSEFSWDDLTVPAAPQVISEDVGLSLDKVEPAMLGTAKKVTISKDDTIILDGGGAKGAIQERSDQIREAIDNASSDYDRCARRAEGAGVQRMGLWNAVSTSL